MTQHPLVSIKNFNSKEYQLSWLHQKRLNFVVVVDIRSPCGQSCPWTWHPTCFSLLNAWIGVWYYVQLKKLERKLREIKILRNLHLYHKYYFVNSLHILGYTVPCLSHYWSWAPIAQNHHIKTFMDTRRLLAVHTRCLNIVSPHMIPMVWRAGFFSKLFWGLSRIHERCGLIFIPLRNSRELSEVIQCPFYPDMQHRCPSFSMKLLSI